MDEYKLSSRASPEQLKAISTTDGPLLIIAGPGSGKTFILVERVIHLIKNRGIQPENIFVATFTNKAASELKTRVSNRPNEFRISVNLNEMYLGTFHSICLRWLEEFREFTRLKRSFIKMDQFDQQYFLYQRLVEYSKIEGIKDLIGDPSTSSAWYRSQQLLRWVNKVSEEALNPQVLIEAEEELVRTLGHCHLLYHLQLDESNALDFSTIQYEALKILRSHPDVLAELRGRIEYLMVDEYQDTNTIQELIVDLLAGNEQNICVVGDDDQGLYRFRGATIRNILQFKTKFPPGKCQQVSLTTNYRSHPDIIDFSTSWIEKQSWQHNNQHMVEVIEAK